MTKLDTPEEFNRKYEEAEAKVAQVMRELDAIFNKGSE